MPATSSPRFDPLSDSALRDPAAALADAAHGSSVFYEPSLQTWVITDRAAIERAFADIDTFSNSVFAHIPVPDAFSERMPARLFAECFLAMDPPQHTAPRKIAQRGFTRPRLALLEPTIAASAHQLIDAFGERGRCDLMSDYALPLTTRTLAGLLGLGPDDDRFLQTLRDDHLRVMSSVMAPLAASEETLVWTRYAEAHERLRALVEERIRHGGEDIISTMAGATGPDGRPTLPPDRVAMHVCELVMAGTDTTANLIANAVVFLSARPSELAALRNGAATWEAAVEETLRRRGSTPWTVRITTRDAIVDDTTIPAGSIVWLGLAAASNDPADHEAPERFDVQRPHPENHLAFGKGQHFCMGAPLARLEGRIGLQALYDRLPGVETDPDAPGRFNGLAPLPLRTSLPVTWAAERE